MVTDSAGFSLSPADIVDAMGRIDDGTTPGLALTRSGILAHRRAAGALDERLPPGAESLRRAAWAGLQDSMPRAAVLSINARVKGAGPATWEDPSLVQLWGPRFSAYVVTAEDLAVFSVGRLPDSARDRQFAERLADDLDAFLGRRRMTHGEAGRGMGVPPNRLRYAATTGRVLIRWDGARMPTIWTVPPPAIDPADARLELARRYLNIFGPTTAGAFARWAGIRRGEGAAAFDGLAAELTPVRSPIGAGWILASDEPSFRGNARPPAPARLLPSGDAYFLLHGADRELLVPEANRRPELWTPRVWPGAAIVAGEVVGTWRRAGGDVSVSCWRALTPTERQAVEAEATTLPLPDLAGRIRVRWG
jgi:hypothetical protein